MAFGLFFYTWGFTFCLFFWVKEEFSHFCWVVCYASSSFIYFSPLYLGYLTSEGLIFFFFLPVCPTQTSSRSEARQTLAMDFFFFFFKHWRFLHPAVLKRLDCRPLERSEVCGIWSRSICFQVWTSFGCFMMAVRQLVAPVMLTASCSTCVNQKCQQSFTVQTGVKDPNHPDAIFNKTELCCLPIKYWQNLCILTLKM